ncbi:MAG: M23 family metallopeptidase [Polyangia bacterium]
MRLVAFMLLAGCAPLGPLTTMERGSTLREVTTLDTPSTPCGPLGWPVEAKVSSGFGTRGGRPHLGIDLVVPEGVPVLAACDGVVRYAGETLRGYGRMILVEHEGGLVTAYAHNEKLLVSVGQPVTRGQTLALSGQTGHVTAPHVHFEVRLGTGKDAHAVDPIPLMESRLHMTAR